MESKIPFARRHLNNSFFVVAFIVLIVFVSVSAIQFYTKLEENHQVLEAEKSQCEARQKEERDAAIKQLRKSMMAILSTT
ncbi:hypothetical protein ACOSP7_015542 [Xanthoceras sorbifolium]